MGKRGNSKEGIYYFQVLALLARLYGDNHCTTTPNLYHVLIWTLHSSTDVTSNTFDFDGISGIDLDFIFCS